ncbi:MAG: flotillin [Candidatus Cloacimonetes bacterium 4572_55]|nr:MAG: flotillin [Candidatus Cloacimonetes bacterium 4572_55]
MIGVLIVAAIIIGVGTFFMIIKMYRKVRQGMALVRNGVGGSKVTFSGMLVVPVLHQSELIDISVKRIEIERSGEDGLICADNVRADIEVAFFVRVNKTVDDVLKVAQSIGCARASDHQALIELFDAKFSEALKTVGKQFDFVDLYNSRERFKSEILQIIGTDLNGYVLDDAAIDYLEQTPLSSLSPNNILDSQGIKKITKITAQQAILANEIKREKEKTITQQDVVAQEAILELNRQLAESQEKQKREIASITAREVATARKVEQEEKWKSEQARIETEEQVQVALENKNRQIIVARKSKEKTEAVESERLEKDRMLEANERERVVFLARIEKEKAIETEKRNIQEVIRERVAVEKDVVTEEEKIKDTRAFATADREKKVSVTHAEMLAEKAKVQEVKSAEAKKEAAQFKAGQLVIEAEADQTAAMKNSEAMKTLAEAKAKEEAVIGMAEVQVMEAKATALEKQGSAEANVLELKALAEAKGVQAMAVAHEKKGFVEANIMAKKYSAEAEGIKEKAEAMKKFDAVGRQHEEFKLRLNMDKDIQLAQIHIQKEIAFAQAEIVTEGLKSARIDIVGGETTFFDNLIKSITQGKAVDRMVESSHVLTDVKETFFGDDPSQFRERVHRFVEKFGMTSQDLKNLTVSALIAKLMTLATDNETKSLLVQMENFIAENSLGDQPADRI